jgi:hypothetical protein
MTLNLQKNHIYMHINIILYKITYHISILAIQCIQGVFGTVVFKDTVLQFDST